ncbi:MAG: hypothetical protein HQK83_09120 [Fibrobacteria bacterium]|nr:hypothetical protein [Fibrobacteria bacterium]
MKLMIILFLFPLFSFSQQLINAFSFDSTRYDKNVYIAISYGPGHSINGYLVAFLKKNKTQIDIYDLLVGKIETIDAANIPPNNIGTYTLSQTFFDADSGWETIVNYYDTTGMYKPEFAGIKYHFKLIDDNGASLVSDMGYAQAHFDGKTSYLIAGYYSGLTQISYEIKTWKFREIKVAINQLNKRTSNFSYAKTDEGSLRVTVNNSQTGITNLQIFDFLGRSIAHYTYPSNQLSRTVLIPHSEVPSVPFISKVKADDIEEVKRF